MNIASMHNIGGFIAAVTSVLPQAATGNVNGSSLDRFAHQMPLSCLIHAIVGASTGLPTGISVQVKLQDSADNSTFADYIPPGASTVAETAALTAINTENSLAVDLSSVRRYVRAVALVTLTAGTSPTLEVAADLILGGEAILPAT